MTVFPTAIYLMALVSAALSTGLTLPAWRRWSERRGLMDRPGHRKIHDTPISLAGGLAVLTGILIPIVVGLVLLTLDFLPADMAVPFSHGFLHRGWQLAAVLLGGIGMVFLGAVDDRHDLHPGIKLVGQLVIALAVASSGIRVTLFVEDPWFTYLATVLWVVTVTNAFNWMDNMNGLCPGLGIIGAWQFALMAALQGQYLVVVLCLLVAGALLGFLPYNFPRARAFLGDSGSHLVGYFMAVLAILPHYYSSRHPNEWAVLEPLLILVVPLGDLVWVIGLRLSLGKPIYIGDKNHLSHRLVRWGWTARSAVMLIWLMSASAGGLTFLGRFLQSNR